MKVERQQVLDRAKELGMTLTDDEVEKHVTAGTLPDKPGNNEPKKEQPFTTVEELVQKHTARQLAEMVLDARSDARERRIQLREAETARDRFKDEIVKVQDQVKDYPELQKKLQGLEDTVRGFNEAERTRRESRLKALDEEKQKALDYLLDPAIPAEKFDQTYEIVAGQKGGGTKPPRPGDPGDVTLTPEQQQEARRMGLKDKDYLEVMAKRSKGQANGVQQPPHPMPTPR